MAQQLHSREAPHCLAQSRYNHNLNDEIFDGNIIKLKKLLKKQTHP